MSKSPDRLEHDVEASRARLDRTLGSLQSRLSDPAIPRSLGDLRRSGQAASDTVERLVTTIRADLMPALLIGAGFALLAYDAFKTAAERRREAILDTQSVPSASDRHLPENHPDRLHDRLDDALEESFPGSDPVSVRITK